ncbi:MAG: DUF2975 domain-containing protein [Bacillus sp. (in: Bacteria)]|nr:DUF2975 domain-containing protein [Bacillus sp. (in: firmicutes)]
MKQHGKILILKAAVIFMGLVVLILSVFLLPTIAKETAVQFPEFAHLRYPVLIGLYVSAFPFFLALYHAFKLLDLIKGDNAFSYLAVTSLRYIQYSAAAIGGIYIIGSIFFLFEKALHPGIIIIGFTITFASVVIAVFTTVLQKLLNNAIEIKSENDLTV